MQAHKYTQKKKQLQLELRPILCVSTKNHYEICLKHINVFLRKLLNGVNRKYMILVRKCNFARKIPEVLAAAKISETTFPFIY